MTIDFYSDILGLYVMLKPDGDMRSNGTYPITPKEYFKLLKEREVSTPCKEVYECENVLGMDLDHIPNYRFLTSSSIR